jgi:hypothetical protein
MKYHFFWKHYQLIHQNGGPDFWTLQMPFVGRPRSMPITVVTGSPDFSAVVRPSVHLSAMGWSTTLGVRLRGKMKPGDVQAFVRNLSLQSAAPFEVAGARLTLPALFDRFTKSVLKDVYQSSVVDALKLRRYLLMTPVRFSGDVAFYKVPNVPKQMAGSDRATLHSMLKGASIQTLDVVQLETEKKFLVTHFVDPTGASNPDFAITYFDYGTLLFMQRTANGSDESRWKTRRSAMQCHAANIGHYLQTTLSLQAFYRDAKSSATTPTGQTLMQSIRHTLEVLPARYTNQFTQSFHQSYGPLSKLTQPRTPAGGSFP